MPALGTLGLGKPQPEHFLGEAESRVVDARTSKSRPNEGELTLDTRARTLDGPALCS